MEGLYKDCVASASLKNGWSNIEVVGHSCVYYKTGCQVVFGKHYLAGVAVKGEGRGRV